MISAAPMLARHVGRCGSWPTFLAKLSLSSTNASGLFHVSGGQQLAEWIAGLDSDQYGERQGGTRKLELLEEFAEPALRAALEKEPSMEARRRFRHLLDALRQPPSEILRRFRSVEVLEKIGSAESRSMLKTLAVGAPEARRTREAKTSTERLSRRAASKPDGGTRWSESIAR
jgi:hypothetical protein